ncbi:MAG: hypothetical protein WC588_01775 [Candidatus Micrarchaeia archaeon]
MTKGYMDLKKHQRMVDSHNYWKAHPGLFARMKKFITPYNEMEEYRNRDPSPIKKVAPYLPFVLLVALGIGARQLIHNAKINSKEKAIAAYVTATPTDMDDGIIANKKELSELAHAMFKLKLTPDEAGTLISIRNSLNCTERFKWDQLSIGRLVETLRYQTKFISSEYDNGAYMGALLLKWASVEGLPPQEALRRDRVYDVVRTFNAHASDDLKGKLIAHPINSE